MTRDHTKCWMCGAPPYSAKSSLCLDCNRKYQRDYYHRTKERRRAEKDRLHQPLRELCIAIGLVAAYQSGYRNGVGDRALVVAEQHRAARELHRQREHADIGGRYIA